MADFGILDLEEGFGDSGINSSRCLVGKVFQGKNLKASVLYDILKVAWRTRAPFYVDDWNNNVFLFRFENEEDRRNIVLEGPWSVTNNLLVLIPLVDGMVVSELNFNICPFWVQIHGLPVEKLNRANAEFIGKRMGKLKALEAAPDGFCLARGFLRIRVDINIEQPLPRGFWLRARTDSNRDRWISFKFEKLSDFCYACGRVGHDNRGCRFVSKEEGEASGYGPELRTGRAKRSSIPVEVIQEEVDAAAIRVQTLIPQRPELQVPVTKARVPNDRSEERTNNILNTIVQDHDVVELQPATNSTSSAGKPWTGVIVSHTDGNNLVPSLNTIQDNPLMGQSGLPNLTFNSAGLGQTCFINNSPITPTPYFVIEPPDSPSHTPPSSPKAHSSTFPSPTHVHNHNTPKPNSLNTMSQTPLLTHNNNQSLVSTLKTQAQVCNVPDTPIIQSTLVETHSMNPFYSPFVNPAHPSPHPHLATLNNTNISISTALVQSPSPISRDISMSTVFNSLSLKRKLDDDVENPHSTRSKILRLCSSPTDTYSHTLNQTSSPSHPNNKPRTIAPRSKVNSRKNTPSPSKQRIPPRAQWFKETGLCEVLVQQWDQRPGEASDFPLDFMMSEVNGRVAGPEQPQTQ
ncbi:hypothetical protein Vadar_020707 [Vaccinium darrowii]|uniref:Uncharacterized protein n=1 Tax=Vaccinium darrowii TaxID=229202 RepID=A0ACB7YXK4_9ERIC|nr:hypothetical protein Vadar_020707 [Vaccinium darrowii]